MEKPKQSYYGTTTELQEIRRALNYMAKAIDGINEKLNLVKSTQITNFHQNITPQVEKAILSIAEKSDKPITQIDKLQQELIFYKREYRWAQYGNNSQKTEKFRGLIISTQKDIHHLQSNSQWE